MTIEQALEIRHWRAERGCTWRRIASKVTEDFGVFKKDCTFLTKDLLGKGKRTRCGLQMIGQDICQVAAKKLNQDPHEEPWN